MIIETLMEKNKPVVTEKCGTEKPNVSNKLAFLQLLYHQKTEQEKSDSFLIA